MSTAERFAALAAVLSTEPDVEPPDSSRRRFGSTALKVGGRIFAMHVSDRLVVKLPAARVTQLVADGTGEPFRNGSGQVMRQWLAVVDDAAWEPLAREALAFGRS